VIVQEKKDEDPMKLLLSLEPPKLYFGRAQDGYIEKEVDIPLTEY